MKRITSLVALSVSVAACGPSPTPKPATTSIETDGPEPQSTEWLYATPNSSGELEQECKLVVDVVRGEQGCSGDLCQHAINLANDWLEACAALEKQRTPEVKQLVAKLDQRRRVSGGECAFQGEELIAKGCPAGKDCVDAAQHWATSCSNHASPLVVRMIEKQVSRSTQKTVRLDTTPCATVLAKLTQTTSCGNEFECQEKVAALHEYQRRCVDANQPQPLDEAVKQATLLVSAGQQSPAILVQETRFAPEKGKLLLDDASGYVVAVGDRLTPNVNLFIKTLRESEFVLQIKLARVFTENNQHYLRVGSIDAADPETFFRRYPSLALVGQREALNGEAGNAAIAKLNELVKHKGEQDTALAGLVSVLTLAEPLRDDADFKVEIGRADKHLARLFEQLAAAKRAILPKPNARGDVMRSRVAFARRSWQGPLFDVTPSGQVELGATNPAVFVDVATLLPASFEAYRKNIDGSIGKALRKLEAPEEAKLLTEAELRGASCAAARKELLAIEQSLLACAFGMKTCQPKTLEASGTQLDETVAAHQRFRSELAAAVASLEEPPKGKLAALAATCKL
ncbi:MAG TPA: hypothetical protein VFU02_20370 [Polyangiaceae bacterium]|nr:hypothetical protein [Polyangiaceae bacterium]